MLQSKRGQEQMGLVFPSLLFAPKQAGWWGRWCLPRHLESDSNTLIRYWFRLPSTALKKREVLSPAGSPVKGGPCRQAVAQRPAAAAASLGAY